VVNCEFNSPMGAIKSSWKRDGKSLRWEIAIPPGATAAVRVPGRIKDITPSAKTFTPKDADDAQGQAQRLTLGSGQFVITATLP